jgi:hypothetical protein
MMPDQTPALPWSQHPDPVKILLRFLRILGTGTVGHVKRWITVATERNPHIIRHSPVALEAGGPHKYRRNRDEAGRVRRECLGWVSDGVPPVEHGVFKNRT